MVRIFGYIFGRSQSKRLLYKLHDCVRCRTNWMVHVFIMGYGVFIVNSISPAFYIHRFGYVICKHRQANGI